MVETVMLGHGPPQTHRNVVYRVFEAFLIGKGERFPFLLICVIILPLYHKLSAKTLPIASQK